MNVLEIVIGCIDLIFVFLFIVTMSGVKTKGGNALAALMTFTLALNALLLFYKA